MANPADQAAIEDAKFKADMARTDAANTMTTLTEQSQQFGAGAKQALAKGMVTLAMTGNTGFTNNAAPVMPALAGSQDPQTVVDLRADLESLQAKLADTPSEIEKIVTRRRGRRGEDGDGGETITTMVANPEYTRLQGEIAAAQEKLSVVDLDVAPRISDPSMLLRASGSDLLTMMNTREMMQRDLNTYIRSQKGAALTMMENAGNYDLAAVYAEDTKNYNTLNTILGFGFKVAGLFI